MEKEEIAKLIDEKIKTALQEFKKEICQGDSDPAVRKNPTPGVSLSLQEFINEKNPRKVASEEMPVIAYYLREVDGRKITEIDENIMLASYKKIDRARPKRLKQAFIDSTYFEKVPQKGYYKLNYDGDYFVEVTLAKERKKA